jgi:hypothetical protein
MRFISIRASASRAAQTAYGAPLVAMPAAMMLTTNGDLIKLSERAFSPGYSRLYVRHAMTAATSVGAEPISFDTESS